MQLNIIFKVIYNYHGLRSSTKGIRDPNERKWCIGQNYTFNIKAQATVYEFGHTEGSLKIKMRLFAPLQM